MRPKVVGGAGLGPWVQRFSRSLRALVDGGSQSDQRYLNLWVQSGFVVVATDYQGLVVPDRIVPALAFSLLEYVISTRSAFPAESCQAFRAWLFRSRHLLRI
jgi:hypothetical protein